MGLSTEQWEALTPEEKQNRSDEKPVIVPEEPYVFIDGIKKPLKNYIAEKERDIELRVRKENDLTRQPEKVVAPDQGDWRKRITAAAEREMEESGSIVPVNTILDLVNQGIGYHIGNYAKTTKQANKVIKDTKNEIRKDCKEKGISFEDYADEFDDIMENVDPQQVSGEGIKIIFNSLIGKKTPELLKKASEESTRKADEGSRRIVGGELAEGTGKSSNDGGASKLTAEQKTEMQDMGFESESDYLGRLTKYREIAKRRGSKNTPTLLSERFAFA